MENKYTVLLFGSSDLSTVPDVVVNHIREIMRQAPGTEFIVGDGNTLDTGFHKVLSGIGARQYSRVYGLDRIRANKFDLDTKLFRSEYNPETKEAIIMSPDGVEQLIIPDVTKAEDITNNRGYFEFCNKQLVKDCSFAICYWDGESKAVMRTIDRLKAQDKYVYVYTAQIH